MTNNSTRNHSKQRPAAKKPKAAARKPRLKGVKKRTTIGLKGVAQSSLNQALQTQKRSSQLADQMIDKAKIADKQPAPKTKAANISVRTASRSCSWGPGVGQKTWPSSNTTRTLWCGLRQRSGLDLPASLRYLRYQLSGRNQDQAAGLRAQPRPFGPYRRPAPYSAQVSGAGLRLALHDWHG